MRKVEFDVINFVNSSLICYCTLSFRPILRYSLQEVSRIVNVSICAHRPTNFGIIRDV